MRRESVGIWLALLAVTGSPPAPPGLRLPHAPDAPQPPTVVIDAGVVQGIATGPSPRDAAFLGIPYAAPPVDALRWRPPAPVVPWTGVQRADRYPPICPQRLHHPEFFDGMARRTGGVPPRARRRLTTSEDCLTLSVWTTNLGGATRQPVFVWVHGGGNEEGWNTQGLIDGRFLARQGIVVVSIEYRVGALGFLADVELSAESPDHVSGNYGLLDQIAALQWVRRNVAAFGGDSARVTVGGQSSGSEDVACLMASPLARGLFRGAILESGACNYLLARLDRRVRQGDGGGTPAEDRGRRLAADLGILAGPGRLAALRRASADAIVAATNADTGWTGGVIVDGRLLPDQPGRRFAAGAVARVPVLVGSTADEMRSLADSMPVASVADYQQQLERDYGSLAPAILAAYPARDAADGERRLFEITTDESFGEPARAVARAMTKAGVRAWLYQFTHVIPTPGGRRLGAFHTMEMPFVFGSEVGWPHGPGDRALRDAVSGYWVQFIKTGDPNGIDSPTWPAYGETGDDYLELGDTIRAGRQLRRAQYDLFAALAAERLAGDPP